MMSKQYNGWSNYQTWCVNLWLENERVSYCYWREQARAHAEHAPDSRLVWEEDYTIKEAAKCMLAEQLRAEFTEQNPLDQPHVYSDLLGAALAEIDWHEIAENLLADFLPAPVAEPPPDAELFPTGRVACTPGALAALTQEEIRWALARHVRGDWGTLSPNDQEANNLAFREGIGLLSAFDSAAGTRFLVITAADRSLTTVLLPDEY